MTTCTTCAHGPTPCAIGKRPDLTGACVLHREPQTDEEREAVAARVNDSEIPAVVAGCPSDEQPTVAGDDRGVVPSSGGLSISAADGPSQPPPVAGSEEPTEVGQAAESRPAPGAGSIAERNATRSVSDLVPEGIPDGVHPDVPAHVYHGPEWADLVSSSTLKRWHKGPAFGLHDEDVSGSAVDIGTAVHALVEGDDGAIEVVKVASRRGKAWTEAVADLAPGRVALTRNEWEAVQRTHDAVMANPIARRVIERAQHELTCVWSDPVVRAKARMDLYDGRVGLLADLKTTSDMRLLSRDRRVRGNLVGDRSWHLQLAWYRQGAMVNGLDVRHAWIIGVTTKPPHVCEIIALTDQQLDVGAQRWREALDEMLLHRSNPDAWTGPSRGENGEPGILGCELAPWA